MRGTIIKTKHISGDAFNYLVVWDVLSKSYKLVSLLSYNILSENRNMQDELDIRKYLKSMKCEVIEIIERETYL